MFGAIGGLLSAMMGAGAQQDAVSVQRENLAFQKDQARKQYRLATAGREDAYGNKQSFDDLLNEWKINLTPEQKAIVDAMQREQKLSLTEDAGRKRDEARRDETRSQGAADDYDLARTKYNYEGPPSEGAINDEINGLMAGRQAAKRGTNQTNLSRLALRMGRGGDLQSIARSAGNAADTDAADDPLKARAMAFDEYSKRQGQHTAKNKGDMQTFAGIMDANPSMPARFSGEPMAGTQQSMLDAITRAIGSGSSNVGSAFDSLARGIAGSGLKLDLSGLDGLFGGSGKAGGGASAPAKSSGTPWDDWSMNIDQGSGRTGSSMYDFS